MSRPPNPVKYLVFNAATRRIQAECNHSGSPAELFPNNPQAFGEAVMTLFDYAAACATLKAATLSGLCIGRPTHGDTRVRIHGGKTCGDFHVVALPDQLKICQPVIRSPHEPRAPSETGQSGGEGGLL